LPDRTDPNGSGKSELKSHLPDALLGVYLNPDEIEAGVKARGYADLLSFGVETTKEEVLLAFTGAEFLRSHGYSQESESLSFAGGRLCFPPDVMNSWKEPGHSSPA
jgi:hypothetical protein